jgi:hypothetical protein
VSEKDKGSDSGKLPGFCGFDKKNRIQIPPSEGRLFIKKNNLEENLPSELTVLPNERGTAFLTMTRKQHKSIIKRLAREDRKFLDLIYLSSFHFNLDVYSKTEKLADKSSQKKKKKPSKKIFEVQDVGEIGTMRLGPFSPLGTAGLIDFGREKLRVVCAEHEEYGETGFCLQMFPARFEDKELQYFINLRESIEKVFRFYKFD